jgi:hypothetical protein
VDNLVHSYGNFNLKCSEVFGVQNLFGKKIRGTFLKALSTIRNEHFRKNYYQSNECTAKTNMSASDRQNLFYILWKEIQIDSKERNNFVEERNGAAFIICLRFPPPPIQINLPQLRSPLRGFFFPICIKTFQQNMGGPFQLLNTLQSKNIAVTFNEVNIKK